jgi:foldase protein PrsA
MKHYSGRTSRTLGGPASGRASGRAKGVAVAMLVLLGACDSDSGNVVARAAGHELTVDQVVEMLARQNTLPNQPDVVAALANIWVDHTLLGMSAREDSLFTNLDLGPLLQPQIEQETVEAYMNSVIEPDTAISDEDLRTMWEADTRADSVRAQHIFLAFPEQATQVQGDSMVGFAEQLQTRLTAGESFEALAGQYSDDSGSAVQGGDLGFFGTGMMVPEFEEVAFALGVDEVGIAASPFGIHVIRVTDRKTPTFDAALNDFRNSVVLGRLRLADSIFLAEIQEEGEIEVEAGAVAVLRELAMNPRTPFSGRAAGRALVSYRGGSYTVSDALLLLNTQRTDLPGQLLAAPDEALDALLRSIGQTQVLLDRASNAGINLTEEHVDSIETLARQGVRGAMDQLGIRRIMPSDGETADEALHRRTLQILRELSAGTLSVVPTDAITVGLRRDFDWEILEGSIGATIERVNELRGATGQAPAQLVPAPPAVPTVADTIGN